MPEIEFVHPDPEPGEDDELVTGRPRREWSPRRQRTVRIAAGAVLAVVAAAVLVGVLQHDGGKQAAGGPPTPSGADLPTSAAPSGADRADHLYSDGPVGPRPGTRVGRTPTSAQLTQTSVTTDDQVCPNENACSTEIVLPLQVAAAVAHAFSSVADVRGSSVTIDGSHPTLRARTVTGTVGTLDISVGIHPATGSDTPSSATTDNGRTRSVSATVVLRGLAVTVSVSGPAAQVPSLATVEALAVDPRLVAVD